MNAFVTSDLDRTLIYSQAASGPAFATADPVCVEIYRDAPLSFMAPASIDALAALSAATPVVPTTTRTPDQYLRVRLPGGPHRFAICSNGGEILVDGAPDPQWQAHIRALLGAVPADLDTVAAQLESRLDPAWGARLRLVPGLFAYVVSDVRIPAEVVAEWRAYCAPLGWTISQQGRKLYTIPEPVTKSRAALEVRRRLEATGALDPRAPWLAAGDGALDADLLAAADAAIRPRHGELEELGFALPHLTLTAGSGIAAGVEIVRWLADRATAAAPVPDPIKEIR
ncbi:HAD family hydrolase [Tsukamurella asaccharolytica]|uniref:HAD family hydrolase n=1 Tax=Tsukamurella asaccharolytica TaxID=2592067 RepID=A0A5C5R5M7_9ACTN|nr:HAD family hydrolase [Tsukamurella asaccharolytica]TWS17996.1 HAD family hydrolase [Tsukamurella asaccharolytica]